LIQISGVDLAGGLRVTEARNCLILGGKQRWQARLPWAPRRLTDAGHMRCPGACSVGTATCRRGIRLETTPHFHVTEVLRGTRWGYSLPSLVSPFPSQFYFWKWLIELKGQKIHLL